MTFEFRILHERIPSGFTFNNILYYPHKQVSEPSLFRVSIYQAASIDVHMKLYDSSDREYCRAVKHPGHTGGRKRTTLYCKLDVAKYRLKFFAYYTLGGLHPCQYFQV